MREMKLASCITFNAHLQSSLLRGTVVEATAAFLPEEEVGFASACEIR